MALRPLKRKQILDAAKILFFKQGFAAANMDEVSKLAKVSKRTLYKHFPTKLELFQTFVFEHWQKVRIEQGICIIDTRLPLREALIEFSSRFVAFCCEDDTLMLTRILIAESERFPNLTEKLLSNGLAPYSQELAAYLNIQVQKNTLIIPDIPLAVDQLTGLLNEPQFWARLFNFTTDKSTSKHQQVVETAVDMFIKFYQA